MPPNIGRDVCARMERIKQREQEIHSPFGQILASVKPPDLLWLLFATIRSVVKSVKVAKRTN